MNRESRRPKGSDGLSETSGRDDSIVRASVEGVTRRRAAGRRLEPREKFADPWDELEPLADGAAALASYYHLLDAGLMSEVVFEELKAAAQRDPRWRAA